MKMIDLVAVLNVLEDVEAEIEQLVFDNEWYVSEVTDGVADAKERIIEEIQAQKNSNKE